MAIKVSGTTVIDDSRNLQNCINLNVTGNVYANTFIGDGSQLTNLPPSGGTITATASGALSDGSTVILNSDGTVSVVVDNETTEVVGTETAFKTDNSANPRAVYDENAQKVVIFYRDDGSAPTYSGEAVVGTVSGNSISFGTPVTFRSDNVAYDVAYDANAQKIVVVYNGASGYGTARIGTVSGTSISFGTPVVFESAGTSGNDMGIDYDANAQKVVIAYRDQGNSNYGTGIVGTVSGTSISFGLATVFDSTNAALESICYHAGVQKVLIAYQDQGNSSYGTAVVGTVSGTSITFGTPVVFESADTREIDCVYDASADKVVITYQDRGNSNKGTYVIATISGTNVSFTSPAVFADVNTSDSFIAYDTNAQKIIVSYRDQSDGNKGKVVSGTVSSTSVSFSSPTVFHDAETREPQVTYDSNTQVIVVAYVDQSDSSHGKGLVYQIPFISTNLTATNYLGISDSAYANNTTATIQIAGSVDDAQSGLTPGQQYFVQANGSIGTTADSPSVIAGTAVAATKLLVKG